MPWWTVEGRVMTPCHAHPQELEHLTQLKPIITNTGEDISQAKPDLPGEQCVAGLPGALSCVHGCSGLLCALQSQAAPFLWWLQVGQLAARK